MSAPAARSAALTDPISSSLGERSKPVILVGMVAEVFSEVAERVPHKIQVQVYLSAFSLPTGKSLNDMAEQISPSDQDLIAPGNGNTTLLIPERVTSVIYNSTEPARIQKAIMQQRPEPMASFSTPLSLSACRYRTVSRAYVECMHDRALPRALQKAMQDRLQCNWTHTLNPGHPPFYSVHFL